MTNLIGVLALGLGVVALPHADLRQRSPDPNAMAGPIPAGANIIVDDDREGYHHGWRTDTNTEPPPHLSMPTPKPTPFDFDIINTPIAGVKIHDLQEPPPHLSMPPPEPTPANDLDARDATSRITGRIGTLTYPVPMPTATHAPAMKRSEWAKVVQFENMADKELAHTEKMMQWAKEIAMERTSFCRPGTKTAIEWWDWCEKSGIEWGDAPGMSPMGPRSYTWGSESTKTATDAEGPFATFAAENPEEIEPRMEPHVFDFSPEPQTNVTEMPVSENFQKWLNSTNQLQELAKKLYLKDGWTFNADTKKRILAEAKAEQDKQMQAALKEQLQIIVTNLEHERKENSTRVWRDCSPDPSVFRGYGQYLAQQKCMMDLTAKIHETHAGKLQNSTMQLQMNIFFALETKLRMDWLAINNDERRTICRAEPDRKYMQMTHFCKALPERSEYCDLAILSDLPPWHESCDPCDISDWNDPTVNECKQKLGTHTTEDYSPPVVTMKHKARSLSSSEAIHEDILTLTALQTQIQSEFTSLPHNEKLKLCHEDNILTILDLRSTNGPTHLWCLENMKPIAARTEGEKLTLENDPAINQNSNCTAHPRICADPERWGYVSAAQELRRKILAVNALRADITSEFWRLHKLDKSLFCRHGQELKDAVGEDVSWWCKGMDTGRA